MTFFPTIKMRSKESDFNTPFKVKATNYSMNSPIGSADREGIYRSNNLSHRSSIDSFENEFGTIPILQRQAVSVPRKELLRKTSKGQLSNSKLPEMHESITSKLGEMNYISTLKHKDSNFKLKMMLNRIERLKYEERRANK